MPPIDVMVVLAVAVFVGTVVQGCVGLGLGLVAAPAMALVAPELMPGSVLWLTFTLPLITLVRDWAHVDWWGLRWALAGRLPATAVGAWAVSVMSVRTLGLTVGVVILLAVALTARTFRLPMRASVLVAAGVVSGISGTATSIGGPPLALVYQRELGSRVRATLAVYFVVGVAVSLTALAVVGELTMVQTTVALWLAPVLALGYAAGLVVRRRIDGAVLRIAIMVVCAVSAATLIVRSLAG